MRKLIVTEFPTLDGMMEEATPWQEGYARPESGQFKRDEHFASGALLLGRVTYEGFAKYWPTASGTGEFGKRMNELPKYVVSGNLQEVTWNNSHTIGANVAGKITNLKNQEGKDILVYGSGQLARFLLESGGSAQSAGLPCRAGQRQAAVWRSGSGSESVRRPDLQFWCGEADLHAEGAGKKPAVHVRLGEYTYRSTVAVMGGKFMLPVRAEHRAGAGIEAGDAVNVTLELGTEPREVAVPEDLQAALHANAAAQQRFALLPHSRQPQHALAVKGPGRLKPASAGLPE